MSDKQQEENKVEANEDADQNGQQEEVDPNALTEEDKKVYNQILASINRVNTRVKQTRTKVTTNEKQKPEAKRAEVQQITQKLIQSKEKSEIVTKEDLLTDVNHSFEEVVVQVFTENKQLKKKMESLVAIIKEQNKKINDHLEKQIQYREQNQKLREDLVKAKDQLMTGGRAIKQKTQNSVQKTYNKSRVNQESGEDYDFWSMPQNDSSTKKRKDFVADSNLWVNDKDIDKSVFITDNSIKRR